MCPLGCLEAIRRGSLRAPAEAAGARGIAPAISPGGPLGGPPRSFTRVVDLTHAMGPDFPSFDPDPSLVVETVATLASDGYNMSRWLLVEHTGTHLDAPIHYDDAAPSAEQLAIEDLVVPLVVIDIALKAQEDADAELTPDDLSAFEALHGPVPARSCVAMHSGWDRLVTSERFCNADAGGAMHFPGFHREAAAFLIEREAVGIAVDTLSLDRGISCDFATHRTWLPAGRWGLEAVAGLSALPPVGATIVVGGPKIKGASGGPARVLALV